MVGIKLTVEETKDLERYGSVYALRDKFVYLVEKHKDGKYDLTIFCGSKFQLVLTYP